MQQTEQIFPKQPLTDFQLSANDLLSSYEKEELHNDLDTIISHEVEILLDTFDTDTKEDAELTKQDISRRLSLYFFMQKTIRNIRHTHEDRNISRN